MGDHLNFNNLLLDNIDNKIPIMLNLSTLAVKTPRATKNSSSISETEHSTDKKHGQNITE